MTKLYPYTGPPHLLKILDNESTRYQVDTAANLALWLAEQADARSRTLTVTFVVLPDGLWIANRRSEHVVCGQGKPVLSAGEMTFAFPPRLPVEVVEISNQSTGYCPEPESWPAVAAALDRLQLAHPDDFALKMVFRRCPACSATNIVKYENFVCALCDEQLPHEWNFDALEL